MTSIDYGIFKDNPSARSIIKGMIDKANKYKYNFGMNDLVESLTGIPSDRTAYDVGEEPERRN